MGKMGKFFCAKTSKKFDFIACIYKMYKQKKS